MPTAADLAKLTPAARAYHRWMNAVHLREAAERAEIQARDEYNQLARPILARGEGIKLLADRPVICGALAEGPIASTWECKLPPHGTGIKHDWEK